MVNYQEIYQKIQSLLWSILPDNSNEVILKGAYYHESDNMIQLGYYNNQKSWVSISINSHLILQILDLIESLQNCEIFIKKPWNHFYISLNRMSVFDMNFSYIPKEDSWHRLIMKGISDLTEDELKGTGIPKELWEERVFYKDSGQLGKLQSYFINKERREEFSNLTDDQYIYQQIAELLRSIAPSNQCNLVLSGYVKNQLSQLDFHQVMDNGQTLHIDMSSDELLTLLQLLEDLQNCKIFAKEPWTYFHITLDKDDKFKMGFSYEN